MTTQTARTPVNKIIVVGPLDSINRDGDVVQGQFRPTQINVDRFRVQMSSPLLGEGFGLAVSVDRTVPGADLIEEARRNKGKGRQNLLAIEGTLLIRTGFDPRFRDRADPEDRGRQVREPVLQATAIRAATAANMDLPSSVVWLEGEVLEPPRFLYHPTLLNVQIASTVVSVIRDVAVPGSRAVMRQRIQVRVAIPVEHVHAAWLYCMGNQVRIEGQLECFMERQSGIAVNRTVAALDATWREGQLRLKGELEYAERHRVLKARDLTSTPIRKDQTPHDIQVAWWCVSVLKELMRHPFCTSVFLKLELTTATGQGGQRIDAFVIMRFSTTNPRTTIGTIPWYDYTPLRNDEIEVKLALEIDRGTEQGIYIYDKGVAYRDLTFDANGYTAMFGGPILPVFIVPTTARALVIAQHFLAAWPQGRALITTAVSAVEKQHPKHGALWGKYLWLHG